MWERKRFIKVGPVLTRDCANDSWKHVTAEYSEASGDSAEATDESTLIPIFDAYMKNLVSENEGGNAQHSIPVRLESRSRLANGTAEWATRAENMGWGIHYRLE